MILKMFSIYDRMSEIYQPPCYFHTVGHALRAFSSLFVNPESNYHIHAADFQVWEIGTFDDQTGIVVRNQKLHLICSGTEIKDKFSESPPVAPLKGSEV